MTAREESNRGFLIDLFTGPFRGHAIILSPEPTDRGGIGCYSTSTRPVADWLPFVLADYERRLELLDRLGHDDVPTVGLQTHTGVFAAAFGCPIHAFAGSPDAAMPAVTTAAEADALPEASLDAPSIRRVFELARQVRERVGPEAPISGPDVQSAFDIAALVWRKQDLFQAIYDAPASVERLVAKCHRLLESFLTAYRAEIGEVTYAHCPQFWAPPELGCSLSEDEAGALSPAVFERFCMPSLVSLSNAFGGMFMHCCADADHQYPAFRRIPHLRGLNRVFTRGPQAAIDAFEGETVLMMAWIDEETVSDLLRRARPGTRFLFNMPGVGLDQARGLFHRLREACPRADAR